MRKLRLKEDGQIEYLRRENEIVLDVLNPPSVGEEMSKLGGKRRE